MKPGYLLFLLNIMVSVFFTRCCHSKQTAGSSPGGSGISVPGPPAIIYKTRADYSQLVPVTLSYDRKSIISYPDPRDLTVNGQLATPTLLHDGFLLDNRGITENVAFLKLTYAEYSKRSAPPQPEEMFSMILDKDPLVTMYACGMKSKYQNPVEDLNALIDRKDFSGFRKLR